MINVNTLKPEQDFKNIFDEKSVAFDYNFSEIWTKGVQLK